MSGKYREIQIICKECKGTGIKTQGTPLTEEPCMDCNQEGYIVWGRIKFQAEDLAGE